MESQSRIDRLLLEVARLPDLHERGAVISKLRAIKSRIDEATLAMQRETLGRKRLTAIAGDGLLPEEPQTKAKLRKAATELQKFIESRGITVSSKKDDTLTASISDEASRLDSDVSDSWQTYIQASVDAYRKLMNAAKNARLTGADEFQRTVDRLTQLITAIPRDSNDISVAVDTVRKVRDSVERLGLEGKAGEFLVAAVRSEATASMFMSPEVQAFLQVQPGILAMLRIRLV
jgi:hypothetical protein